MRPEIYLLPPVEVETSVSSSQTFSTRRELLKSGFEFMAIASIGKVLSGTFDRVGSGLSAAANSIDSELLATPEPVDYQVIVSETNNTQMSKSTWETEIHTPSESLTK